MIYFNTGCKERKFIFNGDKAIILCYAINTVCSLILLKQHSIQTPKSPSNKKATLNN